MTLAAAVEFSLLRDDRHRAARSAGDLQAWLAWLELDGKSPKTLYGYEWVIARLLRAYPDLALAEFTDAEIVKVLRTFPAAGRRTKAAALRGWFAWAKRTRRISENPMDIVPAGRKPEQKYIETFTDAEVEMLCALPSPDGYLMQILFDAGLRRGEARKLQVRHCHLHVPQPQVVVIGGKRGKDRAVPMSLRLQERLAEWFLLDGLKPTDYLWATRPGGYELRRISSAGDTSFMTWWQEAISDAGVAYRNPHTTRHTMATRWLRRGGRLETLSKALGHASIRTTFDLYAHLDLRDVAADLAIIDRWTGE